MLALVLLVLVFSLFFFSRTSKAIGLALLAYLVLPNIAYAQVVTAGTSVVIGGLLLKALLGLAATFHVGDIVVGWIKDFKGRKVTSATHPKWAEAVNALQQAALNVVHNLVIDNPAIVTDLETYLENHSMAETGAWMLDKYGPQILKDLQVEGTALLGQEIKIIFASDKDMIENATMTLGTAANKTVESAKMIKVLPSGTKVVDVVPVSV